MIDLDEEDFLLFPEWKQAVKEFIEANFQPGTVVPHSWFNGRMGLGDMPAVMTMEQHQEYQLRRVQNFHAFRTTLLETHRIKLDSVIGIGYLVVPPQDQAARAMLDMAKDVKRAFRKANDAATYVRTEELTDAQRRERTDTLAKLQMLGGMHHSVLPKA